MVEQPLCFTDSAGFTRKHLLYPTPKSDPQPVPEKRLPALLQELFPSLSALTGPQRSKRFPAGYPIRYTRIPAL